MNIIIIIGVISVGVFLIVLSLRSHAELDKEEEMFKHGDPVEVQEGFFKGRIGIVTRLHPATTLSHGWVGYWIKFENGEESKEAFPVSELKKYNKGVKV